jgi:hypothetical protein
MSGNFGDSRSVLIESLRLKGEDFALSNVFFFNKKGLKAVQTLFRLRNDLLNFAVDIDAAPQVPPPPNPPNLEGLNQDEANNAQSNYEQLLSYWLEIKDAHNRKVPLSKYREIEDFLLPYFKTIEATSAVKGKRFMALTRTIHEPKHQGFFGKLMGKEGDE